MSKSYKKLKRGSERHVQLLEWFQSSLAWSSMKPGPRAVYIELKRKYNGSNNGEIFLSHRLAADAICCERGTAGGYFETLLERGFIIVTCGHHLGSEGIGRSAKYALTELPLQGKPATKEFMQWEKQNPSGKNRRSMAGKSDIRGRKTQLLKNQMSKNPAALPLKQADPLLENPAIYTSNHNHNKNREIKCTII